MVFWAVLIVDCSAQSQLATKVPETVLQGIIHIEERLLDVPEVDRLEDSIGLKGCFVEIGRGVKLYVIKEGRGPACAIEDDLQWLCER